MILVDHEHFELLAWPCMMMVRWHHARLRVIVFAICLAVFPWEFRPWTFMIDQMLRKKIRQIRAYAFGVQFSFKVALLFWILNISVPFLFCFCYWNCFQTVSRRRGSKFLAFHHRNVDQIACPFCMYCYRKKRFWKKYLKKWPVTPTFFSV